MKLNWLDRTLVEGPYVVLVLSDKQYQAAMRHLKVPKSDRSTWISNPHSDATVHTVENPAHGQCFIVALRVKESTDPTSIVGLLVHESVHIWQHFCRHIGERYPSDEFEAYAIQRLSQNLIAAYSKQTAKKGNDAEL